MTMKYKANLYVQEWYTIEIEADSVEEAHDKAFEDGLDGEPTYVEVDLLDINKQDEGVK